MRKSAFKLVILVLGLISQTTFAQSDLEIFGFAQTQLKYQKGAYEGFLTLNGEKQTTTASKYAHESTNFISGSVQQMNIFFRKEMSDNVTAWVNFEILNNYSSDNKWGGMNLEEAWVSYQYDDLLTIKGGLLVPRFNHLNEIKNRMPLIPYITRPLIFEPTLKSTIHPSIYLPERAFIQFTGKLPVENVTFDYALFGGNSETKYQNSDPTTITETGSDSVTFKMVGGRIGAKYGDFYAGVSTTFDAANYQADLKENVKRNRIGFDFGGTVQNVFFEGEYIGVTLKPKNTNTDINKSFYYATLGYNLTEQWYIYGSHSTLKDKENPAFKNGLNGNILGAGFKPLPSLTLKVEYSSYKCNDTFDVDVPVAPGVSMKFPYTVDIDFKAVQLAASFLF